MATLLKLKATARGMTEQIQERASDANELRITEHKNAIKIQAWFRAEKVRAYLRHLNHCALIIQRSYRAHIDRALYRELVQLKLQETRQMYFDYMATKIQTRWRGYYVRKYIFNYYARKRYLVALTERNDIVRRQLDTIAHHNRQELQQQRLEAEQKSKDAEDRRLHYLISTAVQPSIYSSPLKRPQISDRELELRRAKPLSKEERYMLAKEKLDRSLRYGVVDTSSSLEKYQYLPAVSQPLPPITTSKIQGPFRNPEEVLSQRYKPFEPTLRVATSYTSVEESRAKLKAKEWTKRVIDDRFLHFEKHNEKYQPLLDSNRPFGRPKYGTKHFREENENGRIHEQPFKRFVSPVPVFEKLGKTY